MSDWMVNDTGVAGFAAAAHAQSAAVAASEHEDEDQSFIEELSTELDGTDVEDHQP